MRIQRLEQENTRMPWFLLVSASLLVLSLSAPMFCVPPMEHILKEKLLLTHAQTSLLFTVPLIMLIVLPIPAGILADRIGIRKVAGIGAIIATAGAVLRATAGDYTSMLAFTFIYGAGYAILFPNMPKLVSLWVPRQRIGVGTGVYTTAMTISVALPMAITLPLIFPITNTIQGTFLIWSIPAIILTVFWWIFVREPVRAGIQGPVIAETGTTFREVLGDRKIWLAAVLLLLHNFFFFNWVGWSPALMIEKGALPDVAALIASITIWVGIPTVLLVPGLSDKLGLRKPFLWIPSIVLVITSFWAIGVSVSSACVLMAVVGIFFHARFVIIMALPVEMAPRKLAGLASGMVLSLGYVGSTLGPLVGGYILDLTGSLTGSLLVLSGISIAAMILTFVIPETGPKAKGSFKEIQVSKDNLQWQGK